jgi:hypothetical protein
VPQWLKRFAQCYSEGGEGGDHLIAWEPARLKVMIVAGEQPLVKRTSGVDQTDIGGAIIKQAPEHILSLGVAAFAGEDSEEGGASLRRQIVLAQHIEQIIAGRSVVGQS